VPERASPEAAERHPHLREPLPTGWVRVDCHLHTMWSGDATTTPDELAEAAAAAALDVLCITDHSTTNGALQLSAGRTLPARVIVGQEQRTPDGEVIGLFLESRIAAGLRSARDAALAIRSQGGLVYVPHPFDPMRHRIREAALTGLAEEGLVDVIEVRNAKTSLEHLNERALGFAREWGLAAGAGSDAHVPDALGAAYLEMPDFTDAASFRVSLRAARAVGHHYDAPRRFRPRIVPSTSMRLVSG
jgi:predicted metal-dependent phosphoesterase TrpH